jgi:hypothetical protein
MKKCYSFAGIGLEIHIPDSWAYTDEGILAPFAVDSVAEPYVFRFEKAPQLPTPEGLCLACADSLRVYENGSRYFGAVKSTWENAYGVMIPNGREHRVLLREDRSPNRLKVDSVLNVIGAEHLMARQGGFLLHSSYIGVNGKGILFTAPSGTGKSTQAALWKQLRGAEILNGDRCGVCLRDGQTMAWGVPFAGSSEICKNVTLPLAAVVYLRQAPQTTIRPLRGAEAFHRVWEGCSVNTWDRIDVENITETVTGVLSAVPVFELACTPDETAVTALEGVLRL